MRRSAIRASGAYRSKSRPTLDVLHVKILGIHDSLRPERDCKIIMEYKPLQFQRSYKITPRLIIHGGAGNITPSNLPPARYKEYHDALLSIVCKTHHYLLSPHNALDTVTFAVEQLENNPLFNSSKGAVFTRDGINELEASIMVSSGKKKRGVGLMGLRHVKNPIKLAREMLVRGEEDLEGGNGEHRGPMIAGKQGEFGGKPPSGGAQGHCQLYGEGAERLARKWGLEMVDEGYFFVQNRWDEHIKGLEREKEGKGHSFWDAQEYVPQGTCGAVALDADGVCAVATSTGGMTNKLTGRIGDTPTLGAGFWAEEWEESLPSAEEEMIKRSEPVLMLSDTLKALMADCLPSLAAYRPIIESGNSIVRIGDRVTRATAMSGTGNGDSFLRMDAVRTASAIARYRRNTSLQQAVTEMTGPGGELEKSAGERWKKTGEGEGGMIGIECTVITDGNGEVKRAISHIVEDYNCGGMFRAMINNDGKAVCRIWKPGQYDGLDIYKGEGKEYNTRHWLDEKL
jgi:L-asparaginase